MSSHVKQLFAWQKMASLPVVGSFATRTAVCILVSTLHGIKRLSLLIEPMFANIVIPLLQTSPLVVPPLPS